MLVELNPNTNPNSNANIQVEMLVELSRALEDLDLKANNGVKRSVVPRADFAHLLRRLFPTKPEAHFGALQKALFFEQGHQSINYHDL